ncbi:hypothetical protein UCDDA912_g07082 [Diaporthe ampelina]|uniref:Uncharacterized protein n=1 Tax=Diaporthe ampelina TaxID=1214573 RepID=A0A0G2FEH6_9PEZI|nr:hypothetical protein UCDDA912_g07082 [Diaporthe ampelina]
MFYWSHFVVYKLRKEAVTERSEADLTEEQTILRIKFKASYTAYRFSSFWLVIAGFVILCLHVALVLAHFAVIAFGDWWTSKCLDQPGRLPHPGHALVRGTIGNLARAVE